MKLIGTVTEELNDIYVKNNLGAESRMPVFRIDDIYIPKTQSRWYTPKYILQFPWRELVVGKRYLFKYKNEYNKKIRHHIYQYPKYPDFIDEFGKYRMLYCIDILSLQGESIKQQIEEVVDEDQMDDDAYFEMLFKQDEDIDLGSEL